MEDQSVDPLAQDVVATAGPARQQPTEATNITDMVFGQLDGVDSYLQRKLKEMENYSDDDDVMASHTPADIVQMTPNIDSLADKAATRDINQATQQRFESEIQENGGSGGMAKGEEANRTNEKQPQYRPQNRDVFEV